MANNLTDDQKAQIYSRVDRGMINTKIADETGIGRYAVSQYANPYRAKGPMIPPVQPVTPDVRSIVEEVMRRMQGNPKAKPDVIEVAVASPYPIHPQTRAVDISGRKFERTAFLSDLHCPFQDKAAISVVCKSIRDYRPELIVLAGDFYDCYSISDHDKEPGRCEFLQDELDDSKETVKEIDDAAGDAEILFMEGNHEYRLLRLLSRNPGIFKLRSMELPLVAELPKRWKCYANQTRFRLGPLTLLHGDVKGRGTAVKHAGFGMLSKLRTSCIFGHLHRFQTYHETSDDGTIRGGFANGHLCDVSEAKYITSPDWQLGFSTIDYDWSVGIFSVTPHLIVKSALRWGSKTYAAEPTKT